MEMSQQNMHIVNEIPKMVMALIPASKKEEFQSLVVSYIKTEYPDLYALCANEISSETKARIASAIKTGITHLKAKLQ